MAQGLGLGDGYIERDWRSWVEEQDEMGVTAMLKQIRYEYRGTCLPIIRHYDQSSGVLCCSTQ